VSKRTNIAVVGAGYWGRNYVRNLEHQPDVELSWVCDLDDAARARAAKTAPTARLTTRVKEVFSDPAVQAVVIATNVASHHELAMAALEAGKHVMVEKPIAASFAQAQQMSETARERGLILMVGHLLLYHPAVERLRQLIRDQLLGRVYYLHALRVNLGRVRSDENALWSFGPHDLSMISFLLGQLPCSVSARGSRLSAGGRRRCGVRQPRVSRSDDGANSTQLARPAQGTALDRRGLEKDGRLRRHPRQREAAYL
jgi:predicted dehydrogenase